MSTNNPHDPNHNDLPHERGADARQTGADALDALLNEITQGPRSTTTRHGEGHHEPKGRSQPREAQPDNLSAFARAFHQRVEQSDAADPGGAALDPTLWEQIMARTIPPQLATAAAAGHPGISGKTSSWRSRSAASPSRSHPPRPRWEMLANATLALLIVLTAFGAWTVYDRVLAPPPSTPESTVPGVAMQPSTPEATESDAQIDAPPVITTPEPAFDCDFTRDMPIFQQVDESPIDGTALLVTTAGELVLSCPEEPEPVVLATNVGQASPAQWPGVVHVIPLISAGKTPDLVGANAFTSEYVNAFTGKSVAVNEHMSESSEANGGVHGPWMLDRMPDEFARWSILDLRTMEARLIDEVIGQFLPDNAVIDVLASDQSGRLVLAFAPMDSNSELPGSVVVIGDSLDDVQWLTLPDGISRTQSMTLIQNGQALATIDDNSLRVLSFESGEVSTLLESDGTLDNLRTTYDTDVVTVRRIQEESIATETPDQYQPLMYSVNTVTGEVIEIQGADVRDMFGWEQPPSVYLVVSDEWAPQGPTNYRVLDAVTGEELGTIEDGTLPSRGEIDTWSRFSFATSADGSVEVLAFNSSQLYLIHPTIDGPEILPFASPPGVAQAYSGMANIFLSPDGSMLSLTVDGDESRTRWLISFTGDNNAWVEVPSTVPGSDPAYILFVAGTGAQG